jgi:tetratricopeptide (TPR) repeat protein
MIAFSLLSFRPRLAAVLALAVALFTLGSAVAQPAGPPTSESMPERTLRQIAERQRILLADAAQQGDKVDEESLRSQLQQLAHEYELLLQQSPDFAAAYASYGYLLGKIDMRRESMAMLLKANQLDPDIPLVKNQLGNYLAEEGKPLEAINYYLSAIKLEPKEPLYHYQLGLLLYEARDDFLKKGIYSRATLESTMHEAFKTAAELAPDRIEFTYRYAESYADVEHPNWEEALAYWGQLEAKAQSPLEQQTIRLQRANIRIKQARFDDARALIVTVTDSKLEKQKQILIAQLPESAKK